MALPELTDEDVANLKKLVEFRDKEYLSQEQFERRREQIVNRENTELHSTKIPSIASDSAGNFGSPPRNARNSSGTPQSAGSRHGAKLYTPAEMCVPMKISVQEHCSNPKCPGLTETNAKRSYKTIAACRTCHHSKDSVGRHRSAFICGPLSGRPCWEDHVQRAHEAKDDDTVNACFTPKRVRDHKSCMEVVYEKKKGRSAQQTPPPPSQMALRLSLSPSE
eukprot:CAMPEP_0198205086 /NCGR_PEP_ID=MMETSP1445-20131203/8565_1 /TAXON_ID=36898 /ORGANISM="Pyramimonas sp., Strain CCMP2087" /LENGTH=220 /DNA_ID=CAMNT_0043877237 /DNA_START=97 /DNA_END=759 /DNA_ORIENTATION=-